MNEKNLQNLIDFAETNVSSGKYLTFLKSVWNNVFFELEENSFSWFLFVIWLICWIIPGIVYLMVCDIYPKKKKKIMIILDEKWKVSQTFGISKNFFEKYNNSIN